MGGQVSKERANNEAQYCQAIFEQSSDAILANMSHELRTPLNGIIGFSELLERRTFGPLTERQRTYVQSIQTCGWRLLKLVVDIVDLSKIEVGRLPLSRAWTSLEVLVDAALGATQELADGKRVALSVSLQPDLPKVWVDPVRMQQVFSNLLANAVRFTPGGGSAGLTAYRDQTSICVSVTSDGICADAEEQAEDAGLGLALAKRLLEMHGGHIHVDTAVREGSTFRATLPLGQPNEESWTDAG